MAVLRVDGQLTLRTATQLRRALLKCLAEQPIAILVDVSGLTVEDDMSVTAFMASARHAAAWPGVPLLICAPSPGMRAALRRLRADRHLTLCTDLDHGRTMAAARVQPAQVRDSFPAAAASVRAARTLVAGACERWRLPVVAEPARIVTTELVTNAVRQAGTPIELTVTRGGRHLHLAVRDFHGRRSRLVTTADEPTPGAAGFPLVEAVSSSWGCTFLPDGKVTWASLHLTARSRI
ncbi:STAS domain-containing protein [Phytohabitans houttuyneae]|uniref:Sulfate transporter n=1 Tax=Phytohabitans houttuyneae TaxID=1076126 RepID=A0A6V8K0Y4_9ACTN|nr:STAS domain-containing protein [Phytohabitans houttuyneae]GFJ78753.1 sulfate transporter [Phytohabitans houttuyneae]